MIDVERLLDELAERVVARLAERLPASELAEPWRLWDLEATRAALDRSERQVRAWAKSGELPWVRLDGGKMMFDPDDVRAFARSRRVDPLSDRWQVSSESARGAGSRVLRPARDRRVDGG